MYKKNNLNAINSQNIEHDIIKPTLSSKHFMNKFQYNLLFFNV